MRRSIQISSVVFVFAMLLSVVGCRSSNNIMPTVDAPYVPYPDFTNPSSLYVTNNARVGGTLSVDGTSSFTTNVDFVDGTSTTVATFNTEGDLSFEDGTASGTFQASGATTFGSSIDWSAGNVTRVPLTGDIQAYVTAATAGDTLVLASGEYVITSTITINKALNIVGQGHAGYATVAATPRHGTLISCATSDVTGLLIDADNVRIRDLSIDMTGTTSLAINTTNNRRGLVFSGLDVVVNCDGPARGFSLLGSTAILRDLTFYITSTNDLASGVWANNDASTTQSATVDCYNVTGVVQGAATYGAAYVCYNDTNPTYTITLNLSSSICQALAGTPLDAAVSVSSTGGNNAVVNAYFCTFDGDDYDLYQTGTNVMGVGGSVLVNGPDSTFGTIVYRSAFVAQAGEFSGTLEVDGQTSFGSSVALTGTPPETITFARHSRFGNASEKLGTPNTNRLVLSSIEMDYTGGDSALLVANDTGSTFTANGSQISFSDNGAIYFAANNEATSKSFLWDGSVFQLSDGIAISGGDGLAVATGIDVQTSGTDAGADYGMRFDNGTWAAADYWIYAGASAYWQANGVLATSQLNVGSCIATTYYNAGTDWVFRAFSAGDAYQFQNSSGDNLLTINTYSGDVTITSGTMHANGDGLRVGATTATLATEIIYNKVTISNGTTSSSVTLDSFDSGDVVILTNEGGWGAATMVSYKCEAGEIGAFDVYVDQNPGADIVFAYQAVRIP